MKTKTIRFALLAALAAVTARADSLGFIKVGERYKIQFGLASASVVVVSDAGGGWYRCRSANGEVSFVNFNKVLEIIPEGPALSSTTDATSPAATEPRELARRSVATTADGGASS